MQENILRDQCGDIVFVVDAMIESAGGRQWVFYVVKIWWCVKCENM